MPIQYVSMPQQHWVDILDKIREKISNESLYTSDEIPDLIDQLYHIVLVTEEEDLSDYSDSDIIFVRQDLTPEPEEEEEGE